MNLSAWFIDRPVATTLASLGLALAGVIAFFLLPVAPLPQVDFPTLSVSASLPGASPETMAATVATPLERALGSIAGVNEITSSSSLGNTRITLQFDLERDINAAARDVQAAINAARALLPSGLPSNPSYRKVNPADAPILILALTSDTLSRGQMYDAASTVLAQRLAQVDGIGQVVVGGGALPAVRVELDPRRLEASAIALDEVRQVITSANANRPKGALEDAEHYWQIGANDQALKAEHYAPLVVRWRNGASVRLADLGQVVDAVQDIRNYGVADGRPAILLMLFKQPGSNIIETVARVRALLPHLRGGIAPAIALDVVQDRTPTLRASLREVERALATSVGLVILVVLLFLRHARAALIPSVTIPVSLAGTLVVMYLCGYSLDNLSLMALTVATGFVVDDAIVVLENVARHLARHPQDGARMAALRGTREIGFTVLAISLSLVAVFIPIWLMGGVVGRFFREFAVVLSAAIGVSMAVSLSTTPMMCALLLRPPTPPSAPPLPADRPPPAGRLHRALRGAWGRLRRGGQRLGRGLDRLARAVRRGYRRSLAWSLRHQPVILLLLAAVVGLNVWLYLSIPKGFLPQQDTGRLVGFIRGDQASSYQAMRERLERLLPVIQADEAVQNVSGFTGGGARNSAQFFVTLKPLRHSGGSREASADEVAQRLRAALSREPGARVFFFPAQDLRIGGRPSPGQYEYTLQADGLQELREWEPRIVRSLMRLPELTDVSSDQEDRGVQVSLVVDRDAATRLGLNMATIDSTLNSAFGQRQVGVIYNPLNQYRVVMELAPEHLEDPESLRRLGFTNRNGVLVPLAAFARLEPTQAPLSVSHQSGTPASTISFNLPPGVPLSVATEAIGAALAELGVPVSLRGSFEGAAKTFAASSRSEPWLILAAIVTIYLVLGMLYESLIHPITILSTLPSAGVGALLALQLRGTEFSIIALIGVILLIGIVKKNAILMIDFALASQRRGRTPTQAIFRAGQLRLRPILMTTLAALFGAVPLALGSGDGAELRQPLGISVVGGLLISQLLTLYTTPVVFVGMDRLARWRWGLGPRPPQAQPPVLAAPSAHPQDPPPAATPAAARAEPPGPAPSTPLPPP